MKVETLFLADYAEVINGKLYVQGGLITQAFKPTLPAPLDLSLVIVFSHTRYEAGAKHTLEIGLHDADAHQIVDPLRGEIAVAPVDESAPHGLPFLNPAALRLAMPIPSAGRYEFTIKLDQNHVASMPFHVHLRT